MSAKKKHVFELTESATPRRTGSSSSPLHRLLVRPHPQLRRVADALVLTGTDAGEANRVSMRELRVRLRPALAQLQTIRQYSIRPGLNIQLQLPHIVLQKAETTVTVPDRGSIMITGFKDIMMKDMQSGEQHETEVNSVIPTILRGHRL